MLLDVHGSTLEVAVPPGEVDLEKVLDEVLEVFVEEIRAAILAGCNLLVGLHGVVGIEGRVASVHLVDQNAEAPPVNALAVSL